MPACVLDAMREGASAFVDMDALQAAVGREIARLTNNESCYVSSGAAAGLVLSVAAIVAGTDEEKRARLPDTGGLRNEIIVHRKTRVGYDFALRQAGGKLVEIGDENGATPAQLEAAIAENTAAVFYFPNANRDAGTVPIPDAVRIAQRCHIRVVVDAAAQLPPRENLWKYTRDYGADLALFSGGKGLCGPQSSGLMLGRRELTEAAAFHGLWRPFIGRPMKVGKEELFGVLAAVQWFLARDERALLRGYEKQVADAVEQLSKIPGVTAHRSFPSEAGQPMPRARALIDETLVGKSAPQVLRELLDGDPGIDLAPMGSDGLFINPQTLQKGEMEIIVARLREALAPRFGVRDGQDPERFASGPGDRGTGSQ